MNTTSERNNNDRADAGSAGFVLALLFVDASL